MYTVTRIVNTGTVMPIVNILVRHLYSHHYQYHLSACTPRTVPVAKKGLFFLTPDTSSFLACTHLLSMAYHMHMHVACVLFVLCLCLYVCGRARSLHGSVYL